jgi:hypothetical protein
MALSSQMETLLPQRDDWLPVRRRGKICALAHQEGAGLHNENTYRPLPENGSIKKPPSHCRKTASCISHPPGSQGFLHTHQYRSARQSKNCWPWGNFGTPRGTGRPHLVLLLRLLSSHPTHVFELVPDMPRYVGYHDAMAKDAGGVWFSLADHMSPLFWCKVFLSDIAADVISDTNPAGGITSSNLELAAEVMAIGVILELAPHIKPAPLGTLCNNMPTISWVEKMASRAKTPTAGRLLRGLTFMLHCSHMGRFTTVHVPGMDNVMANIASRPAKT